MQAHDACEVGQPAWDAELTLHPGIDPPVHPALDRIVDGGWEFSPADEAIRDFVGELPTVSAVEEIPDGLIGAAGRFRNTFHGEHPGFVWLRMVADRAKE